MKVLPVPAFPFIADPDADQDLTSNPAVHSDADPDPALQTMRLRANPDPQQCTEHNKGTVSSRSRIAEICGVGT